MVSFELACSLFLARFALCSVFVPVLVGFVVFIFIFPYCLSIMCHPSVIGTCLISILLCASKFHHISFSPSLSHPSENTATTQFSALNVIPISFFFTSPKSSINKITSCSFAILLLLSGDIHLNPGPSINTFKVCTLNICSLLNPLKFTAISDLAESRHIDLFALTETWITSASTSAELFNATPPGFTLISCPRPAPINATKSHIVGGGTAYLIREPATLLSTPTHSFKSFEMSSVTLKLFSSNLTVFNIYRSSSSYHQNSQSCVFF